MTTLGRRMQHVVDVYTTWYVRLVLQGFGDDLLYLMLCHALFFFFFFFNDPPPPEIYPLPLHAALPISADSWDAARLTLREHQCKVHNGPYIFHGPLQVRIWEEKDPQRSMKDVRPVVHLALMLTQSQRSEEHTSELQSPCNLVCRLLLEK